MTRIVIIGATGFIGRQLVGEMKAQHLEPVALTRNPANAKEILGEGVEIREWNGSSPVDLRQILEGAEGMINLAGANIASGLWTQKRKKLLADSRVLTGKTITAAILGMQQKPGFLLQGSATGYYGTRVTSPAGEGYPSGRGFLAELTETWEGSVHPLENAGMRTVFLRTGIVLGPGGGILKKFLPAFRLYGGVVPGPGDQWVPWIHIRDHVRAMVFLARNPQLTGPFNLTAPKPVVMKEFAKTIGKVTGSPAWLKAPAPLMAAVLGEMGRETILSSQNIIPQKLLEAGFDFSFEHLRPALEDILKHK